MHCSSGAKCAYIPEPTFFYEQLLSLTVHKTNRFCSTMLCCQHGKPEIQTYMGFMVVRDYWSTGHKLHNNFIASHITRDRLEEISRYLHFVDNETLPTRGYHRLQNVLPIISAMKERFLKAYNPHPQASIDEAMIPFKGDKLPRLCTIHALADSPCPRWLEPSYAQ